MLITHWLKLHGRKDYRLPVRTIMLFWEDLHQRGFTDRTANGTGQD